MYTHVTTHDSRILVQYSLLMLGRGFLEMSDSVKIWHKYFEQFLDLFCLVLKLAIQIKNFPGDSVVKNLPANAGVSGLIPRLERSLREGKGNPLQYSCLENPTDRGLYRATVHGVTKVSNTI